MQFSKESIVPPVILYTAMTRDLFLLLQMHLGRYGELLSSELYYSMMFSLVSYRSGTTVLSIPLKLTAKHEPLGLLLHTLSHKSKADF